MNTAQQDKITLLNDSFRRSGFGYMMTPGVQGVEDLLGLMRAVREFSTFTEDNDPHGEHDFGSLVWKGEKIFWKIDYYDTTLKVYEDPLSSTCRRVVTVMLAEEY